MKKYRLKIEDHLFSDKDDLLWEFESFIVGISRSNEQYKINHYTKSFDKSCYVEVDNTYTFDDFVNDWWEIKLAENERGN